MSTSLEAALEAYPADAQEILLDGKVRGLVFSKVVDELFKRFTRLKKLSLVGNGIVSLEHFPTIDTMTHLCLDDNKISGGFDFLANARLRSLKSISLCGCPIKSVDVLQGLTLIDSLISIRLEGCPVQEEDYEEKVFEAVPQLQWLDGRDRDGASDVSDEDDSDEEEDDGANLMGGSSDEEVGEDVDDEEEDVEDEEEDVEDEEEDVEEGEEEEDVEEGEEEEDVEEGEEEDVEEGEEENGEEFELGEDDTEDEEDGFEKMAAGFGDSGDEESSVLPSEGSFLKRGFSSVGNDSDDDDVKEMDEKRAKYSVDDDGVIGLDHSDGGTASEVESADFAVDQQLDSI
jgi:hypothetical protein